MSFPQLAELRSNLEDFDRGPCAFDLDQCKTLRRRIYHAFYYHRKGWLFISFSTETYLKRMLARIKGWEEYLLTP